MIWSIDYFYFFFVFSPSCWNWTVHSRKKKKTFRWFISKAIKPIPIVYNGSITFIYFHLRHFFSLSLSFIHTRTRTHAQALSLSVFNSLLFSPVRHNDLPWNIRKFVYNQILNFNFTSDLQKVEPWSRSNWSHTDLPRLRAGLMGAQVRHDNNNNNKKSD